ncbi:ABC transporter ATP-binding protein [uncultured Brevundimonas sp.]|uniref:ABC transporter ATP-binding protein n=1 Tax=uncultured Brevundimonas sp. TaxID=213418 RepID=UPI00261FFA87|nr:ABC transporter ATP-binding protein [uncultured Brevundimonas sp.]
MSLLSLNSVSVIADGRQVLKSVTLQAGRGELIAICGPNGAGKSTLLKAVAGLQKLSSGVVTIDGKDVRGLSPRQRGERLAYLAQDRSIAWNLPAVEIAALGGLFLSGADAIASARKALDLVGVGHLADRGVAEMSGGERARVLLARALATNADVILADEPVAGLDPDAALLVMQRLKERTVEGGTLLMTLHDLSLAAHFADRVIVIADGAVVADDKPLSALNADVLARHFNIAGQWVETENGPLLATRRL